MTARERVIVALSGGVDSAVAALRLVEAGHDVECLHMTNWQDDDGYCRAAEDLRDARATADLLGVPLHRANFSDEYRDEVFAEFLEGLERGETPNPDVLCNRHIKFGVMQRYARRLGATAIATGHYARTGVRQGQPILLTARDRSKDQTYFLHGIRSESLANVIFPIGDLLKQTVREDALRAGLPVAAKRDSTGICFIGERPYADFLARYLAERPGPIVTVDGATIGRHRGVQFYTLGQRNGLGIGGLRGQAGTPWYVAAKRTDSNELVVVQDARHPLLFQHWLAADSVNWIGPAPEGYAEGKWLTGKARTRYRQPGVGCRFRRTRENELEVSFAEPVRSITPGQYVVLYQDDRCLGGARIACAGSGETTLASAV